MSVIEGLARPSGARLLLGEPQLLDLINQDAIASLLTLITLRLEFLGDMRAIPDRERNQLRLHRVPSDDWKIWIAEFHGDDGDQHWSRTYAAQLESKPTDKVGLEYCNVRVTTLVLGKLCAHLFYSPVIDFEAYEGVELTQIWPRQNAYVDTSYLPLRTGKEVLFLHEAFARESRPMPRHRAGIFPCNLRLHQPAATIQNRVTFVKYISAIFSRKGLTLLPTNRS